MRQAPGPGGDGGLGPDASLWKCLRKPGCSGRGRTGGGFSRATSRSREPALGASRRAVIAVRPQVRLQDAFEGIQGFGIVRCGSPALGGHCPGRLDGEAEAQGPIGLVGGSALDKEFRCVCHGSRVGGIAESENPRKAVHCPVGRAAGVLLSGWALLRGNRLRGRGPEAGCTGPAGTGPESRHRNRIGSRSLRASPPRRL